MLLEKDQDGYKILISVPKKLHRTAVKRNLLKRRIREVYRRNKQLLPETTEGHLIAFIYLTSDILTYEQIEVKLRILLKRLSDYLLRN